MCALASWGNYTGLSSIELTLVVGPRFKLSSYQVKWMIVWNNVVLAFLGLVDFDFDFFIFLPAPHSMCDLSFPTRD